MDARLVGGVDVQMWRRPEVETKEMIKHLTFKEESFGLSKFFFYHVSSDMEVHREEVEYLS